MRNYIIHHVPGEHLTFSQRQTLAADWNAAIRGGRRMTLRGFAARHGLNPETWRREYLRGAAGMPVRDPADRRRRKYCEYDPFTAQDDINENNGNKGVRMTVTNHAAASFRKHVVDEGLSPYDAVCRMKDETPGRRIPCLSAWYKHINAGDIGVHHGDTPYHPDRRRKGREAHPAKTVPGRLTLDDRPREADDRGQFGHYEMDTVVSSANGMGGLLVLLDRKSRRCVLELIAHVAQGDVVRALKRMKARGALGPVLSLTTDNGCEFLSPRKIKAVTGCDVHYTRAYASWEKGPVENCNRLVRRWYPKGTDFGKCTRPEIRRLEKTINSIRRKMFNGKSAYEYDTDFAQPA